MPESSGPSEQPRGDFRVRADSDPRTVGSAIAKCIADGRFPRIKVVGHGAVGQCVKAIAIASHYCRTTPGLELATTLSFETVPNPRAGPDATMSAMVFQTFDIANPSDV